MHDFVFEKSCGLSDSTPRIQSSAIVLVWHWTRTNVIHHIILTCLLACLLTYLLTYLLTLPTVSQERTTRSVTDTNNDCDVIGNPRVRRAQHTTHVNEKIKLTTKFQIHDKRAQLTWTLPYKDGRHKRCFSCKDALISTHYLTLPYLLACLLACLLTLPYLSTLRNISMICKYKCCVRCHFVHRVL